MASFTVKATYNGQTRKFAAPSCSIPTYEQLSEQLVRVFSLTQGFWLSKLIFCPSAGKQLLIGLEVRSKADYDARTAAYTAGVFPGGMLKVSICDSSKSSPDLRVSSGMSAASTSTARQLIPSRPASVSSFYAPSYISATPTPAPISHAGIPPPPIIYSSSPSGSSSPYTMSIPQAFIPTPPGSCCDVSQNKEELEKLMTSFIRDFDRIASTFGFTAAQAFATPKTGASPPQIPPKPWTSASKSTVPKVIPSSAPVEIKPASSSNEVIHRGIMCDGCKKTVFGIRYKCMKCRDFDYCSTCLENPAIRSKHSSGHKFFPVHKPTDPIHRGIVCDHCNLTISGVRHKCLDCPDFDLCSACIGDGAIGKMDHSAFHEFFEIKEPGKVVVHTVNSTPRESPRTPEVPSADATAACAPAPAGNSAPIHHPAICDLCESQVVGDRYKCMNCPDFDVCTSCYTITPEQHPAHGFVKIKNKEDLILNRSAQPKERHGAWCNVCKKVIAGVRYKCMHPQCPDYDLCSDCEAHPIPVHPIGHPLLKMKTTSTVIPTVYRVGQTTSIPERPIVAKEPGAPVILPVRTHEPAIDRQEASLPQVNLSLGDLSAAFSHLLQPSQVPAKQVEAPLIDVELVAVAEHHAPSTVGTSSPLSQEALLVAPTGTMTPLSQQFANDLNAIRRLQENLELECPAPTKRDEMNMPGAMPDDDFPFVQPQSPVTKIEMAQCTDTPTVTLPAVILTPTPSSIVLKEEPTAPAEATPPVLLVAKFVSDLNIADGQNFPPGAEFVKSWVLENTGTRHWPEGTELRFVAGDRMGTENNIVIGAVPAGSKATVSTPELKAPETAGRYVAYWRLFDGKGLAFGTSVWIDITVTEPTQESSSDGSLAASSIIMPQVGTISPSVDSPVITVGPVSTFSRASTMLSEDAFSIADSDMSLVDAPSVSSEGEPRAERAAAAGDMEYVVLYDEVASEDGI